MATTATRIPDLPNEILHCIVSQLAPPDLKNARLSSRLLAMTATPLLFRQMTLVPYMDCLESFTQLMHNNPQLAEHVRVLIYDANQRYSVDFVPEGASADNGEGVKKRMRDNGFWRMREGIQEMMLLKDCLRALPGLTDLHITEFDFPLSMLRLQQLPSYFHRMCSGTGIRSFRRSEGRTPELKPSTMLALQAAHYAGIRPLKIVATGVDHESFLGPGAGGGRLKEMPIYKALFGDLKLLTLKMQDAEDSRSFETTNLGTLVNVAKKVVELSLSMPDANVDTWTEVVPKQSWLTRVVRHSNGKLRTRPTHPYLELLSLSRMICQDTELVAFIHNHRHTLKCVDLSYITLVKALDQESPPCWVKVLRELRSCKVSIRLRGNFTNLHRQWWDVGFGERYREQSRKTCLKAQIEKWASGKGASTCPIEQAAVKVGSDNKEIVPARDQFFKGDSTFLMMRQCHESLEENDFDDTDTDDDDDDEDEEDSDLWDSDDSSDFSAAYHEMVYPDWENWDGVSGADYDEALEAAMNDPSLEHGF